MSNESASNESMSSEREHSDDLGLDELNRPSSRKEPATWEKIVRPLASLKLTVVLFLLSIFIVLAGTFAQVNADIWDVIQTYFRFDVSKVFIAESPYFNVRELFVWIEPSLFFPASFFPKQPEFPPSLA